MPMKEGISTVQKLMDQLIEFFVNYSFQVIGAIIVLILGFVVAKWVSDFLMKLFGKKKMDVTISKFFSGGARILVIGFAVIIALSKFGITIAPFIAAISAMAFGASFAIQGPLSNYGAGLSIILSRSFAVGDTISVAGVHGVVEDIKLACTILTDEDGIQITIPNKHIVGEIVHNSRENKVSEGIVGISYESDPEKATRLVEQVFAASADVAKVPKAQVGIQSFGDSSINISYRYWVPTTRYFQTSHSVNLGIHRIFQQNGIAIPFPQRDIRIVSQSVTS